MRRVNVFFYSVLLLLFTTHFLGMAQANYVDQGDFALRFEEPLNEKFVVIQDMLKYSKRINRMITSMNNSFIMPAGVEIVFRDSGGPSYDMANRIINVGYDFVSQVSELVQKEGLSRDERDWNILDIVEYVIYFEMARALLDVWEVPLHAARWESEKQLSILLVSWMTVERDIITSVVLFQQGYDESGFENPGDWDRYSLERRRLVPTLQFLFGWDPDQFADTVSMAGLSKMDLAEADQYYQELSGRWSDIVAPYVRD